jgi:dihydrolipoamide dehydrogenase
LKIYVTGFSPESPTTKSTKSIKIRNQNMLSKSLLRLAPRTSRAFSSSTTALADYDVCIIGGGPGGYVSAIKASQLGFKTVCIESRGALGGTCLNVGCIPSKALLHSSHLYEEAVHEFESHGIIVDNVRVDLDKMQQSKNDAITGLTQGIEKALFKKYGVDYIQGHGKIIGATEISVALNDGGNRTVSCDNMIIASGSEPTPLPPVPVDNEGLKIVDSTGALNINKIPEKMAVIGGGVIGLEMGSVWRRLGTEVTVIEFLDAIIPGTDKEIVKTFQRSLKKQGMKFKLKTKVTASELLENDKVKLTMEPSKGGDPKEEEYDVVLVSTGRRPFTEGLGLEEMGIEMDKMGRVVVDEHFRTNIPSIFAIGDVIDGPMLAHKAEEEGIAAVEFLKGMGGHVNYDAIPGVIYTFPEVATVGKTEEQLKEDGTPYNKGTFPMQANSRARTVKQADGIVKILSHKETDQVLGVHIVGSNAGEMIMEGVIAVEYGASSEDIARTCHAHPTLSEAFKEAAMATYDKPIHF